MKSGMQKLGVLSAALFFVAVLAVSAFAAGKAETFTGEVSDSMCGAKHAMEGSKAQCTRACVKKGSSYALVVGDKVYTLQARDQASLDQLDKLAGEKATVSGKADGDSIEVSSVSPAK
jgi:hypothetical protein